MPLITLNKSIDEDNKNNRVSLNKNSFINNVNKIETNKNNNNNIIKKFKTNNSQNFQAENSQINSLNYNSNNNKKLTNYTNINVVINKEKDNKYRINKRMTNQNINKEQIINKVSINDRNSHGINNLINNNLNNNKYNYHSKYISSITLDNNNINVNRINKNINKNDFNNIYKNKVRANSNNITECFLSKEKNKKPKQNPPLIKNPKKLNILSLIQENNRKIKDINVPRQRQFHSFVETDELNYNKIYSNNMNVYETIDYILYPDKYTIKDTIDVLDDFDDMNTIIRKINFNNIDIKSNNIFTVCDDNDMSDTKKNTGKKKENYLYNRFCENFNHIFDQKFSNRHQNMSASQNKIKSNNYLYHSKQSGSTKDSNKENSSTKKVRIHSYLETKFVRKKD